MQLKSYPCPCPSIPFHQTCWYEMKAEEVELPAARAGLQPQHPAGSDRAAPPTASESAKCWQVSKGSNCRWKKTDKYLLLASRNTQERAACTSIQNWEHAKKLFPEEKKIMWTCNTCESAGGRVPQALFYLGTEKKLRKASALTFMNRHLSLVFDAPGCNCNSGETQQKMHVTPCSVCSVLMPLSSLRHWA